MLEWGMVGPGGYHIVVDHTIVLVRNHRTSSRSGGDRGFVTYVRQPAGFPAAMESWPIGHLFPAMDSKVTGEDDLGMPPEVVVDLAIEFQYTDVLPTSRDWESDRRPATSNHGGTGGGCWYPRSPSCCWRSHQCSHWLWRQLSCSLAQSLLCPQMERPQLGWRCRYVHRPRCGLSCRSTC